MTIFIINTSRYRNICGGSAMPALHYTILFPSGALNTGDRLTGRGKYLDTSNKTLEKMNVSVPPMANRQNS